MKIAFIFHPYKFKVIQKPQNGALNVFGLTPKVFWVFSIKTTSEQPLLKAM
jgi:hypothetical protein